MKNCAGESSAKKKSSIDGRERQQDIDISEEVHWNWLGQFVTNLKSQVLQKKNNNH